MDSTCTLFRRRLKKGLIAKFAWSRLVAKTTMSSKGILELDAVAESQVITADRGEQSTDSRDAPVI